MKKLLKAFVTTLATLSSTVMATTPKIGIIEDVVCQVSHQESGITGAVAGGALGGIGGSMIGSMLFGRSGSTIGGLVGGVAGASMGEEVGKKTYYTCNYNLVVDGIASQKVSTLLRSPLTSGAKYYVRQTSNGFEIN